MRFSITRWFCAAVLTVPAYSATFTIDATDSGWYDSTGGHNSSDQNYFSGGFNSTTYRNFFVFDLSSVSGTISSVTLRVTDRNNSPTGFPTNGNLTYTNYDISTSIATLTAGGAGQVATFADLGGGTSYGSVVIVNPANTTQTIDVALNGSAILAIQALVGTGQFAIGGAITPNATDADGAFVDFNAQSDLRQLIIETRDDAGIPEPSTYLLGAAGLSYLFLRRRR